MNDKGYDSATRALMVGMFVFIVGFLVWMNIDAQLSFNRSIAEMRDTSMMRIRYLDGKPFDTTYMSKSLAKKLGNFGDSTKKKSFYVIVKPSNR